MAQLELPPRSPGRRPQRGGGRRCPLSRHFILNQEIGAPRTCCGAIEEMLEQRGRQPEGWTGYDLEGRFRQIDGAKVGVHHFHQVVKPHPGQPETKPVCPDGVGLDGHHPAATPGERDCECTPARPDLDYQVTGLWPDDVDQPVNLMTIDQEVLAEGASPRVSRGPFGGHGPSHSQP